MPSAPLVRLSALIVNYRSYDELEACLTSLTRALDLARDEIIVVDHDSDPARQAEIAERFPYVRLCATDANPGFGAGMNAAAARATAFKISNSISSGCFSSASNW